MSRGGTRRDVVSLLIDPPVGPSSSPREIHAWLDELDRLREEHRENPAAIERIDQELARVIGWLRGRGELSGSES